MLSFQVNFNLVADTIEIEADGLTSRIGPKPDGGLATGRVARVRKAPVWMRDYV